MLTVTSKRDPVWVDLPGGARIQFKPLTTHGLAAGRAAAREMVLADESGDVAGVGFTIACAAWGALAWEGIGDDAGAPLALTRENVQALLEQNEAAYQAIEQAYIWPALGVEREKNGSAPSQRGTSQVSGKKKAPARAGRGAGGTTAAPVRRSAKPAPTKSRSR